MGMGMALMAAGTALSAGAQISGGIAAGRAGESNARNLENQAEYVKGAAGADASRMRGDFRKFAGKQRADMAAFGASSSSGTGLLLAREAAKQAKLDELNVTTEGLNRSRSIRAGASVARFEGRAQRTQKIMGGLGTAISGAGEMYMMAQG